MKFTAFLLATLVLFALHFALATTQNKFSIQELVDQYYAVKDSQASALKLFSVPQNHRPRNCYPEGESCTDVACEKLGTFGCDDMDEIKEVNLACRGNFGGSCLRTACNKLGSFGCDDIREVRDVARACVGNYDTDCFESVCRRFGSFACDDLSEVIEVLRSCAGN